DGIRDFHVTGVQTCALPICRFVGYVQVIVAEYNIAEKPPLFRRYLALESPEHGNGQYHGGNAERDCPDSYPDNESGKCPLATGRSEERRVGKEWRSRWWTDG